MEIERVKNRLRQWPLLVSLWRLLRHTKARLSKPPPKRLYYLVLKRDETQPLTKRAVLSYIVHSFSIPRDDPRFLHHINIWRAKEIVRILNQLSYIVDVVDCKDTGFVPRKKYDLFIGHGGINFEKIVQRLPDSTVKIYFSTGCYWKFHNEQELARFAALSERRGIDLPPDRLIKNSEDRALFDADGIIGIGNSFTRRTYVNFSHVIILNNTVLYDDHYEQSEKNFEKGRKNFLYFAGSGCVHKGLDLLLEAFCGLEEHLWICSHVDQRFAEVYSDELYSHSNIHLIGLIQPRSPQFYDLMDTCNYAILPSCSEGGSQSMVECMNQGLIPVVSPACGLEVGNYGVMLDLCAIEEIRKVVQELSTYSADRCCEISLRARKAAVTNFSESEFSRSMKEAIESIVERKGLIQGECR